MIVLRVTQENLVEEILLPVEVSLVQLHDAATVVPDLEVFLQIDPDGGQVG